MGKRILGVIAFAAIAAVAGWNYQQNKQEVVLSDLALENVEALAAYEINWGAPCVYSSEICYFIGDEFGIDAIFGYSM